jgi:hypothetical protein
MSVLRKMSMTTIATLEPCWLQLLVSIPLYADQLRVLRLDGECPPITLPPLEKKARASDAQQLTVHWTNASALRFSLDFLCAIAWRVEYSYRDDVPDEFVYFDVEDLLEKFETVSSPQPMQGGVRIEVGSTRRSQSPRFRVDNAIALTTENAHVTVVRRPRT